MDTTLYFDSTVYHKQHYFLIGSTVTSTHGIVDDPEVKMQVVTRCILHLHRKGIHR